MKQGEEGQESHKLWSKSHVTQVVMGLRELVIENSFRETIATLAVATLATLLTTALMCSTCVSHVAMALK
jgi:hypothetical protein